MKTSCCSASAPRSLAAALRRRLLVTANRLRRAARFTVAPLYER